VLKFSFSYLIYRWLDGPQLLLENADDKEFGVSTGGFPVVGLRVKVFWKSFNMYYEATVKRWSKSRNQWVLKYDLWEETVLEDVPVIEWLFI
jgi:hypothetical protein